jgi:hypothetical protein
LDRARERRQHHTEKKVHREAHPRDISLVFFFDPKLNCYFETPYRDTSRPPLTTLWELRECTAGSTQRARTVRRGLRRDCAFRLD